MSDELQKKIEKLFVLNDMLVEKAHELYHKENLMNDLYDTTSINNDKNFSLYKRNVYNEILSYATIPVDEEKMSKLIELRHQILEDRLNLLSENTIGTALNITREIWNDILIDLKRHSKCSS